MQFNPHAEANLLHSQTKVVYKRVTYNLISYSDLQNLEHGFPFSMCLSQHPTRRWRVAIKTFIK